MDDLREKRSRFVEFTECYGSHGCPGICPLCPRCYLLLPCGENSAFQHYSSDRILESCVLYLSHCLIFLMTSSILYTLYLSIHTLPTI